jgi:hypothetical protein
MRESRWQVEEERDARERCEAELEEEQRLSALLQSQVKILEETARGHLSRSRVQDGSPGFKKLGY